jgi:hypothetical protein
LRSVRRSDFEWSPAEKRGRRPFVDELLDLIEDWPVGAVIERRLDERQIRG